jgi:hypothetical protein
LPRSICAALYYDIVFIAEVTIFDRDLAEDGFVVCVARFGASRCAERAKRATGCSRNDLGVKWNYSKTG